MKRITFTALAMAVSMIIAGVVSPSLSRAEEPLRYSCSNQVFNAFEMEKIEAFTKDTGIQVDVFTSSSGSATYRMMSGYSDIASTARPLHRSYQESGYSMVPICKDPLAVIAKAACGVEDLTAKQLSDVFSGQCEQLERGRRSRFADHGHRARKGNGSQ